MSNAGRDAEAKAEAGAGPIRATKQQVTEDRLEVGWDG